MSKLPESNEALTEKEMYERLIKATSDSLTETKIMRKYAQKLNLSGANNNTELNQYEKVVFAKETLLNWFNEELKNL